jgi:sugar lactone lactonase YvrE
MSFTGITTAAALISAGLGLAACGGSGSAPPTAGYAQQPASTAGEHGRPATSCLTSACIYVTDISKTDKAKSNSVNIYAESATGDTPPLDRLMGSKTKLGRPSGIAVDVSHNVYVTGGGGDSGSPPYVAVYSSGTYGNAKPSSIIEGSLTGLYLPDDIAVDSNSNIYVTNNAYGDCPSGCGSVVVFAAGAHGNVPPAQVIVGSYTELYCPNGIAVDADQNIYVSNYDNSSITVYAAGATGNVSPSQTIAGNYTDISGPGDIAVSASKNIYVADYAGAELLVFAAGSNGNVAPTQVVSGPNTGLSSPQGMALDSSDNMYVTDDKSILVYASNANGNTPPIQAIIGKKTKLTSPKGIAVR